MSRALIRSVLRRPENRDGLTAREIAEIMGIDPTVQSTVLNSLKTMPDCYIDRWVQPREGRGGPYAAVWCVVEVPENCPRPGARKNEEVRNGATR
jgi:hypothetical protein